MEISLQAITRGSSPEWPTKAEEKELKKSEEHLDMIPDFSITDLPEESKEEYDSSVFFFAKSAEVSDIPFKHTSIDDTIDKFQSYDQAQLSFNQPIMLSNEFILDLNPEKVVIEICNPIVMGNTMGKHIQYTIKVTFSAREVIK